MHITRQLSPTDNLEIAETLALAFQNEPGWSYVIPNAKLRSARLAAAFHLILRSEHRRGAVFGTNECEAVTLWRGPGQARDRLLDRVRLILPFAQVLKGSLFRALEVSHQIEQHLPTEPFWYLHFAGCHPAFQGRGFGGAAIRAGLSRVDQDGLPAHLETADEKNIGLYERFGFEVKQEWQIPEGPIFWSMLRPGKTRH